MKNNKYPKGVEVITGPYIINDNHEILLVKSPKFEKWAICGGHVDPGETLIEAVKRETLEELGVEIEVLDIVNVGELIVEPPEFKREAHYVFIDYWAQLKSCDFKFNAEITEVKWFNIADAINDESVSKTIRKCLKKHLEKKK